VLAKWMLWVLECLSVGLGVVIEVEQILSLFLNVLGSRYRTILESGIVNDLGFLIDSTILRVSCQRFVRTSTTVRKTLETHPDADSIGSRNSR
jgi:hypothetical protein